MVSEEPTFASPVSQLATFRQFLEPSFKKWACEDIGWQFGFNRKLWEYAFILQAIDVHGMHGKFGLGFGVGREPLVPVLLKHRATLTVTDLKEEEAQARGWDSMRFDVVDINSLTFRFVDMNKIPDDLQNFDFLWSCGSLEHIGGKRNGMRFIEESMRCLRLGGVGIHTTEFNLTPEEGEFESPALSLYDEEDIHKLAKRLIDSGHSIFVNVTRGSHQLDRLIFEEPPPWELTLYETIGRHRFTSIGLIIQKGRNRKGY